MTDAQQPPASEDRRGFLKMAGASAVAVAFLGGAAAASASRPAFPKMAMSSGVILPDPSLCIGCLTCEVACSQVHVAAGMSGVSRIRIYNAPEVKLNPEIERAYPGRGTFKQQDCLMCPDAPCLPVCPNGSLHTDPKTGARVINESTCIACGKCEDACPFDTIEEARATNQLPTKQSSRIIYDSIKNVYTKCDLCSWRPEGPACVEKCPINIRINQGILQSKTKCLDVIQSDQAGFDRTRAIEA